MSMQDPVPEGFELVTDSRSESAEDTAKAIDSLFNERESIELPGDTQVQLWAGMKMSTGDIAMTAEVRELTGDDEEALARLSRGNLHPAVLWLKTQQAMLERAVVQVGTEAPTPRALLDLCVGDRDALLLGIRRATYGDDLEMRELLCPKCRQNFDVIIELNKDINYRSVEDPNQRSFEVTLHKGSQIELRHVTGADQIEAVGDGSRTVPEQNTVLINRCCLKMDGRPLIPGSNFARRLGLRDRKIITDFLVDHRPGPMLWEVQVPCSNCDEVSPLALATSDLF